MTNAALVLAIFPLNPEHSIHYAYGLLLIILFSISSFVRKFTGARGPQRLGAKTHGLSGLIVVGAIAMFYSIIASASGQVVVGPDSFLDKRVLSMATELSGSFAGLAGAAGGCNGFIQQIGALVGTAKRLQQKVLVSV